MKDEFWKAINEAFIRECGKEATIKEGEPQIFELNNCTVILSFKDNRLITEIYGYKPIKVDYDYEAFE